VALPCERFAVGTILDAAVGGDDRDVEPAPTSVVRGPALVVRARGEDHACDGLLDGRGDEPALGAEGAGGGYG